MKRNPFLWKLLLILPLFLSSLAVSGQTFGVRGTVTDAPTGETLIGVSVAEKGTTNGVMTDIDGQYTINVQSGATLVFSYVGYVTQEIKVTGETLDIVMGPSPQILDEVIVVGYGVQKKSVTTAAISSIKADDLGKMSPTRVENVLKGQVSGVQITTNSGQPGSESKVRIRGTGTTNNSDPLYIVDGMAVSGGISNLNPTDIASVEILKDAASAAVYGARAANGVILITTKSGVQGKTKINYDFSYGFQNPWKKKSVLNAEQYMIIRNEMRVNGGETLLYSGDQITAARNGQSVNTDWQDEVFNDNAPVVSHQISVSGGNDKISYFLSLGYFDQDGIIGGNYGMSNYNRWSIRSNNTYEVLNAEKERNFLNKVKVGTNISYARAKSVGVPGGVNSEFGSVLGSAIGQSPLVSVYANDDDAAAILAAHPTAVINKNTGRVFSLPPDGFQEIVNPLALLNRPERTKNNEDKIIGTFFVEVDVLKGLKFKSTYGFDLAFWGADAYRYPYYLSDMTKAETDVLSYASSQMNRSYTWQLENTLTYNFTLADKHNFSLLAGQSAQKYKRRYLYGQDFDLISFDPHMAVINAGTARRDDERTEGYTEMSTLASYFGRIDYNFNEKYMLQATVRRDGSSKFGPNNKWGVFPSFSLGWNLMNEEFMANIKPQWFDMAKFRVSWGVNGNQNIESFGYAALLESGQNYYFGTGKGEHMYSGASSGRIPNPDLKWEESKQTDIGIDTRFFKGALSFTFDYFHKKTTGMLKEQPIPSYVGKKAPWANAGTMTNSGVEFDLGYRFAVGDFNFAVNANASYVKNKLIDLGTPTGEESWGNSGASGVENFIYAKNGMVWPFFYGWKTDGILQNQAEADEYNNKYGTSAVPGDVRFANLNNDNAIDDKDRTMIGKGAPDWTYGLTINVDWKDFDFTAFFQGVTGSDIFDISQRADIPGINRPSWILDRWAGEGTSNKIPRVTSKDINRNWRVSDLYVKSGDYCRLKNIQLGYTLPVAITKKASIERLRLFVGAENLLTFTKYKDGFDPEIGDGNQGVDKGIYPQSRTITFGASITF
ncbi:TonB-dependent receptor [Prevotella sp. 10(H)]|uniref:SusC/RagA family TonB-linked outer membrane protein n=1 Tax=Prevotella sp. 10(H) TaxID=1158294 RepID=UPI0004A77D60|nr:TonB-dependent receptor [Prevotella sp. 10(H)]